LPHTTSLDQRPAGFNPAALVGFDHFFVKPVDFADLNRILQEAGAKAEAVAV